MDRRKRKSQDAITAAFMELLAAKPIEKISISEIAAKADVNRGTIYLSYIDKYDILEQIIDDYLEQLLEYCSNTTQFDDPLSKDSLIATFTYVEKEMATFQILLAGPGLQIFKDKLHVQVKHAVTLQLASEQISDVLIAYHSSAIVGVLEWWFSHANNYLAEEVALELRDILQAAIPIKSAE